MAKEKKAKEEKKVKEEKEKIVAPAPEDADPELAKGERPAGKEKEEPAEKPPPSEA